MLHQIHLHCINHFFHRPQQDESQLSSGQNPQIPDPRAHPTKHRNPVLFQSSLDGRIPSRSSETSFGFFGAKDMRSKHLGVWEARRNLGCFHQLSEHEQLHLPPLPPPSFLTGCRARTPGSFPVQLGSIPPTKATIGKGGPR